ncbi:3'-5' exonuclease [Idiomarina sp. OT37-5b]|jgi:DNA polymerase-3 subunit epsilon|uniref:3'-5' exonuclease n=1 Tax=Idiomarina sp. OT37-5b TaxID=2100422 RepID=UPI000CF8D327|nr:3'-5' exonuclease [Idiomarina sp. OT37-5b]AVJ55313.1 3'-5' exonuclease [Idiomarina sp. OT37-5b]
MGKLLGALADWYQRRQQLQKPWTQQRYVALDIETTGLDPKKHQVLSIAWMSIEPPVMHTGSAQYHVFSHGQELELGQSPTIHGLTRQDFLHSSEPRQTYAMLSRALSGAVLVCHHKGMDWRFLKHIEKQYFVNFRPLGIFDTLAFEKNSMFKDLSNPPQKGQLTLNACRLRHGLPNYTSHHALTDTLSCAELFLAQAFKFSGNDATTRELIDFAR